MKQGRKEIMAGSFYLAKRSVRSPAWAHQLTVTAIEATTSLLLNTPKNHSFLFQEYCNGSDFNPKLRCVIMIIASPLWFFIYAKMAAGNHPNHSISIVTEVKSKFDAEFRRFSVSTKDYPTFEDFQSLLASVHLLQGHHKDSGDSIPFHICYIDPKDNDLLPINNTDIAIWEQCKCPMSRGVAEGGGKCQRMFDWVI